MRTRTEIIADQRAFGAGGGNSLLLEVLMDIRDLLIEEKNISKSYLEMEEGDAEAIKTFNEKFELI